jgi:hypothetical protein
MYFILVQYFVLVKVKSFLAPFSYSINKNDKMSDKIAKNYFG